MLRTAEWGMRAVLQVRGRELGLCPAEPSQTQKAAPILRVEDSH